MFVVLKMVKCIRTQEMLDSFFVGGEDGRVEGWKGVIHNL